MSEKNKFQIEEQWRLYLERVGLPSDDKLPQDQRREMKRTFFGAIGQMLVFFRDDLTQYDEESGAAVMDNMLKQVHEFFKEEVRRDEVK